MNNILPQLAFSRPGDYKRMKEVLVRAGYSAGAILERLGVKDINSINENDLPLFFRRTSSKHSIDILIRLFLMEAPCDAKDVEKAIKPANIKTWIDAGLLRCENNMAEARVKLMPYNDIFICYDSPKMLVYGEKAKDYVMGIGQSSLTLANATIRKKALKTLDLGTGCGFQAFLAAGHSDFVLGTDQNPRAIEIAGFNAMLNGFANMDFKKGNLFEPAGQNSFDLIVTNPPFVISPEKRYTYRDGGMDGDKISRAIAEKAPLYLNKGGFCQILCNWVQANDEDWKQSLKSWFENTGCDVWVIRSESRDAATYATTWIRHTEKAAPEEFPARFEAWMNYYDTRAIDSIGAGIIIMRKSSGKSCWFHADEAPDKMLGPCGNAIEKGFKVFDFLHKLKNDEDFLKLSLIASNDLRLERISAPSQNGWVDESFGIYLVKGLAYAGDIDFYVADIISRCNGKKPLKEILNELAARVGKPADDIAAPFCGIIKGLVERSFLLPLDLCDDI